MKSHITRTKSQINLNLQYSMTKTFTALTLICKLLSAGPFAAVDNCKRINSLSCEELSRFEFGILEFV